MSRNSSINRRRFVATGAMGLAGASLVRAESQEEAEQQKSPAESPAERSPKVRRYNTLGRTGLEVSDVSLGGATEASVLNYALDRGINLVDTAEQYGAGEHEKAVGRAFKDRRDEVVVITKHVHGLGGPITRENVIERFDASLERLGFEYVDIAMLHHVADPGLFHNEELLGAYETLKKQGKFRHLGFSTHDAEAVIPGAIESGVMEVMLTIYNSIQYPERSELIAKARKAGIGVLAMKTMAGRAQDRVAELVNEKRTFSQAAITWALTDPSVDSVLISIRTFEHVDEYLQASGKTLTSHDREVLATYNRAVDDSFCRIGCTECEPSCPHGVAVGDIMRFGMYFENYGEQKVAMAEYAALPRERRASPCERCDGPCLKACPHHLAVPERLRLYDRMLRIV